MSAFGCEVCSHVVGPDGAGNVLVEGIVEHATRNWVWGPVLVHDYCRTRIRTPYDDGLGSGEFIAAWERIAFTTVERGESKAAAASMARTARAEIAALRPAEQADGGAA